MELRPEQVKFATFDAHALKAIDFTQNSADDVSFKMDSISLYPVVIEFDKDKTYEQAQQEEADEEKADADAKAKTVKTVTVNVKTVNASAIDKAVKKAGGSNKYVTRIVLGSKVKTIKAGAFKKYGKVKTLELKTKKLTKKSVKNSLKSSKVKTVKVKAGSKKVNKKLVKKYKKFFTKKNAGKKVTVKL